MTGRERCKAHKEIFKFCVRNQELDTVISECDFKGDCMGTCPAYEAELLMIRRLIETVSIVSEECKKMDQEMLIDDRNLEMAYIICSMPECSVLNGELEELGLSECTF